MTAEGKSGTGRWHSQPDADFCFVTGLSDKGLNLFVGLPHQRNAVPFQDLHSCSSEVIQTKTHGN